MEKFMVLNKRTQQEEEATVDGESITVGEKTLSASTFQRWYKRLDTSAKTSTDVIPDTQEPNDTEQTGTPIEAPTEGTNTEVVEEEVVVETAAVVAEENSGDTPENDEPLADSDNSEPSGEEGKSAEEIAKELEALLSGGKPIEQENTQPSQEGGNNDAAPTAVYSPILLDGYAQGTKGGKCEKVFTSISILGKVLNIMEYNGFITDVKVLASVDGADLAVVYKSPKMSLKDTLEWLGLTPDEIKVARKEIVALRKTAKQNRKAAEEAAATN